jgi:WD40 repeat protein
LTDLDPSGRLLVASGYVWAPSAYLEVADARTGTVRWSYSSADTGARIGHSYFSTDGTQVISGLFWDDPHAAPPAGVLGVVIWDAETGELLRRIEVGACGGIVAAVSEKVLLVRNPEDLTDVPGCAIDPYSHPVQIVDLDTGASRVLADEPYLLAGGGTLSGDGRLAGFDVLEGERFLSVIVDVTTGERVFELDADAVASLNMASNYARRLNHDGSLLLYGDRPMLVYDVAAGSAKPIARLPGIGGETWFAEFDPGGDTVWAASRDGTLRRWDARTAQLLAAWGSVGTGRASIAADGRTVLVSAYQSPVASLLDTGARGDVGGVPTSGGFVPGGSLVARHGLAAFVETPGGETVISVIDLQKQTLLRSIPGWGGQTLAISPDGGSVVASPRQQGTTIFGPPRIIELRTGSVGIELQGGCWFDASKDYEGDPPGCRPYPDSPFTIGNVLWHWSPDGTMIAGVDNGHLLVWDATDGGLVYTSPDGPFIIAATFTADSKGLVVSDGGGRVELLGTETWAPLVTRQLDQSLFGVESLGFADVPLDGLPILAYGGAGTTGGASFYWLDPDTLEIVKSIHQVATATIGTPAVSPDRSVFATGDFDGHVRVWDLRTGELRQQMEFGTAVKGVVFIDDRHLAVTPTDLGYLLIMTVDPQELGETVRRSLTRTFTASECSTYGITPCPTLEEIRGV